MILQLFHELLEVGRRLGEVSFPTSHPPTTMSNVLDNTTTYKLLNTVFTATASGVSAHLTQSFIIRSLFHLLVAA